MHYFINQIGLAAEGSDPHSEVMRRPGARGFGPMPQRLWKPPAPGTPTPRPACVTVWDNGKTCPPLPRAKQIFFLGPVKKGENESPYKRLIYVLWDRKLEFFFSFRLRGEVQEDGKQSESGLAFALHEQWAECAGRCLCREGV